MTTYKREVVHTSKCWVRCREQDAALAARLRGATLELDVARLTPRRAPAVLHLVVVCATFSAVADGQHAVIELLATGAAV